MSSPANPAQESIVHTLARRSIDRLASRIIRLTPALNRYRVVRGVRVPMRDGAELVADVFAPATSASRGTILIRAPYGRGYPLPQFYAQPYAARGLHVVIQSVRGTYGSTGVFEPALHEADDGLDTVEWLRQQSWFTGRLATIGASYLGLTQWALLQDPPPELKAAVIMSAPHDYSVAWATGSFALDDYLGWCNGIANQNEMGPVARRLRALWSRGGADESGISPTLPVGAAGRVLLGAGAPWYESWLEHPDRDDPFWDSQRFTAALDHAKVPVFLINGWQDVFLEQTLEQYDRLSERNAKVALTIGPWTHARMLRQGASTFAPEAFDWLTSHLDGDRGNRAYPVRVFVTWHGWLELTRWPPTMDDHTVYLQAGGGLGSTPPPATAPPSTFTYDPTDPTPTIGGRLLAPTGGYVDDTALAERPDVVSFTGDALAKDLFVIGMPVVEVAHSADNPYVDVFVRLSQVDAEGNSTNVSEGLRRVVHDGAQVGTVRVELDGITHRFPAGSRIRVLVAGGSYPRFAANPGSGEPLATAVQRVPATHFVHHGVGGISRLVLPASEVLPAAEQD